MGDLSNLENLIKNLEAFDFEAEMVTAIDDNKETLLNLQASQMFTGVDKNDNPISLDGEGYSLFTQSIKKKKGQPIDRVTLRDTGALYSQLEFQRQNKIFGIVSAVPYFNDLKQRTGEEAFLPDEATRLRFANEMVIPTVSEALQQKVGWVITQK